VLGDVGDPEPIGRVAGEVALDVIAGAVGWFGIRRNFGRPVTPARPARRISSATASAPTVTP
jgi:hypothetical protein